MRDPTCMPYDALPQIDLEQCTGCGRCVALCPTQAVALINGQAAITQPAQCTFCEVCESYCPVGAIGRPFIVVLARRSNQSEDAAALSGLPPDQPGVA